MSEFGFHQQQPGYNPQNPYQQNFPQPAYPPQDGFNAQPSTAAYTPPQGYQQPPGYVYAPPPDVNTQAYPNVAWYQPGMDTYSAGPSMAGNMNYSRGNTFDDEPPLLEELGIDVKAIMLKTRAILLHRMNSIYLDELDMGGALILVFLLGGIHLMMGKLHMGVILGWSVLQSMLLWWLASQLSGNVSSTGGRGLDLYHTCCMVGYCMIPQIVNSSAALMLRRGPVLVACAIAATFWSGSSAAKLVVRRSPSLSHVLPVLTYTCSLLYASFALLTVY